MRGGNYPLPPGRPHTLAVEPFMALVGFGLPLRSWYRHGFIATCTRLGGEVVAGAGQWQWHTRAQRNTTRTSRDMPPRALSRLAYRHHGLRNLTRRGHTALPPWCVTVCQLLWPLGLVCWIEEDVSCLAAHTGRHLVRVHGPPLHGTVSCTHGRVLPKHSHGRAVCGVRAVRGCGRATCVWLGDLSFKIWMLPDASLR